MLVSLLHVACAYHLRIESAAAKRHYRADPDWPCAGELS